MSQAELAWTFLFTAAILSAGTAAVVDYRTGEIPNRLTGATLVGGALAHAVAALFASGWSMGVLPSTLASILLGAALCGLVPYILWRCHALGGGDLKLFVALGALLGLHQGLRVQLLSFGLALLLLPAWLAWRGELWRTVQGTGQVLLRIVRPSAERAALTPSQLTEVRFGPAVFAGVVTSAVVHVVS